MKKAPRLYAKKRLHPLYTIDRCLRILIEGYAEREALASSSWAPSAALLAEARKIADPELVKAIDDLAKVRPLNRYAAARYVERLAVAAIASKAAPPAAAEFLLCVFASKQVRDGLSGDFEEKFRRNCKTLGRRRAKLHYWAEAIRTIWPLAWRALKKAGGFALLLAAAKRILGG